MIADPPLFDGAINATLTWVALAVGVTPVGTPGLVATIIVRVLVPVPLASVAPRVTSPFSADQIGADRPTNLRALSSQCDGSTYYLACCALISSAICFVLLAVSSVARNICPTATKNKEAIAP